MIKNEIIPFPTRRGLSSQSNQINPLIFIAYLLPAPIIPKVFIQAYIPRITSFYKILACLFGRIGCHSHECISLPYRILPVPQNEIRKVAPSAKWCIDANISDKYIYWRKLSLSTKSIRIISPIILISYQNK